MLLLLLLLLALAVLGRGLAENLLERPDLAEEEVALGAAQAAVGSDVLGPHMVGQEVVDGGGDAFEGEQVVEGLLLVGRDDDLQVVRVPGAGHADLLLGPVGHDEAEAVADEAEVVAGFGAEGHFLEGRDALVALGRNPLQGGWAVRQGIEDELRRDLVGQAVGIDKHQPERLRLGQDEARHHRRRAAGGDVEFDGAFGADEAGRADGFVEEQLHPDGRTLHGADTASVGDFLGIKLRVGRKFDLGVGLFQPRVFEDRELVAAARLAAELDPVDSVGLEITDGPAEDRIVQAAAEGDAVGLPALLQNHRGIGGKPPAEPRQHDERRTLLHARIARRHFVAFDDERQRIAARKRAVRIQEPRHHDREGQ